MKKINIQREANIKAEGKLSGGNCKPVVCLNTGDVYTSCMDAAEAVGVHISAMSAHLRGKTRTVHGKKYMYLSSVAEGLDVIVTRLRETSAVEEDARKWREYQEEQEVIRKAEAKRLEEERKAEEKRQAEITKLMKKREKLNTQIAEYSQKWNDAINELVNVDMELEELGINVDEECSEPA